MEQKFKSFKEAIGKTIDFMDGRYSGSLSSIKSGFSNLDKLTGGFELGQLVVVGARPCMGKSAFVSNIAAYHTFKSNKNVLVFNLESSSEDFMNRILSSISGVDCYHLRAGKFCDGDWTKLIPAIEFMSRSTSKSIINEQKRLSVFDLCNLITQAKQDNPNLDLIIIDYIQLIFVDNKNNRTEELTNVSKELKVLAMELNIVIIAVSELNRSLEQRPNKRPILSDFRGSGTIEDEADIVIFIYRDECYFGDTEHKGIAEISVSKQRMGMPGTILLSFSGKYSKFDNMT